MQGLLFTLLVAAVSADNKAIHSIGPVDSDGGEFGNWGPVEFCDQNNFVTGIQVRSQEQQGGGTFEDDTALNGVRLQCEGGDMISSDVGSEGDWLSVKSCGGSQFITGFRVKIEGDQGLSEDDTAINRVEVRCSSGDTFDAGSYTDFGDWSDWYICDEGTGICGMESRIDETTGSLDNAALSNLIFTCCDPN